MTLGQSASLTSAVNGAATTGDHRLVVAIDRGVPMPTRAGHGPQKYPWHLMEVGDSFAFPAGHVPNHAYASARQASKNYAPKTFKAARAPDGLMRCWRTA